MSKVVYNKLPVIGVSFWVTKICATTLGETGGDLLAQTLQLGYLWSSSLFLGVFFLALSLQLFSKKYHPLVYWFVIIATSTSGTTISDFMDRTLGLGYANGTAILVVLLAGILAIWKWSEKSLSVTAITSRRSEIFYWAAILVSNTLGTALGDFLSDSSGFGFSGGAILIGSLLSLVVLAHFFANVSEVLLFWIAFVLTRPFGATFGDFLTKPVDHGGLNIGTGVSSLFLFALMAVLVFKEFRDVGRRAS